jgi:hypothetical protein
MSAIYYGINNGDAASAAAVDSSTTSKDVEIVVADVTKFPSREALLLAIEKLEEFVTQQGYLPV